MVFTVYYYDSFRKKFRNFLRLKGKTQREVIFEISQGVAGFEEKGFIPVVDDEKVKMSIECNENDLNKIKAVWIKDRYKLEMNLSQYVAWHIYNYMQVHREDEIPEKKDGKNLSIYLSAEDWDKLNRICLEQCERPSSLVKKLIRGEYDKKDS